MEIPFYGIKRFYADNEKEILDVVHSVYSGGLMFGDDILNLEQELCRFTGRKYAVAVGSCTDALYFALKNAGVGKGDEVIVTSFSFIASGSPIIRAGAVPVFVDIDLDTFLMNPGNVESKITPRTKAIIGVHLFGQTLDIAVTEHIAQQYNLVLIEDAAQGLGARSGERKAGSMGNVSCLSFDPTKVISAFGSGGALLTDDENTYNFIKKIRYHGKGNTDDYEFPGYNCRLSAPQCALLNYQMNRHLTNRIERLRAIASIYNNELDRVGDTELPFSKSGNYHIYHKYVIRTSFRDKLKTHLGQKGIESMIHYSRPLSEYSLFRTLPHVATLIKNAKNTCAKVLSLPIYPELKDFEIDYICKSIRSFF